jgi:hypothetical protein
MRGRLRAACLSVVYLTAFGGCGEHAGAPPVESSMEEATVKGTVRVRGRPVSGGTIRWSAANINRPKASDREVPINKDGTYAVKAFLGQNFVEINSRELRTPALRQYNDDGQTAMVKPGENTVDFDFPPPARQ